MGFNSNKTAPGGFGGVQKILIEQSQRILNILHIYIKKDT